MPIFNFSICDVVTKFGRPEAHRNLRLIQRNIPVPSRVDTTQRMSISGKSRTNNAHCSTYTDPEHPVDVMNKSITCGITNRAAPTRPATMADRLTLAVTDINHRKGRRFATPGRSATCA